MARRNKAKIQSVGFLGVAISALFAFLFVQCRIHLPTFVSQLKCSSWDLCHINMIE